MGKKKSGKSRSKSSRSNSKRGSKKKSKSSRKSKKNDPDDSSSTQTPRALTKQTMRLINSIRDHALPLLKLKAVNSDDDEDPDDMVGKNRMLFALNRAAERALKRSNVFGPLKQLRAEAQEADDIVEKFLEKEEIQGTVKPKMSLVAPKCALCGSPCKNCNLSHNLKGKTSLEKKPKTRPPKTISWGVDHVSNFERSEGEVPGAGFYPDPDSDSDDEDSVSSAREEVAFDPKDFVKSKKGLQRPKLKPSKR